MCCRSCFSFLFSLFFPPPVLCRLSPSSITSTRPDWVTHGSTCSCTLQTTLWPGIGPVDHPPVDAQSDGLAMAGPAVGFALPCLVLPCLVLPCLALPCPALSFPATCTQQARLSCNGDDPSLFLIRLLYIQGCGGLLCLLPGWLAADRAGRGPDWPRTRLACLLPLFVCLFASGPDRHMYIIVISCTGHPQTSACVPGPDCIRLLSPSHPSHSIPASMCPSLRPCGLRPRGQICERPCGHQAI